MKSTHSEDLECLRSIRGRFGSRRIFCVEYEFTGQEIIERHGGRIKKQINISDIVETAVSFGQPNSLIVKTNNTTMKIQILPSLKGVIDQKWTEIYSKMTESERQRFEDVKREVTTRIKRTTVIASVILALLVFALICFLGALKKAHSH
jgi:hypothetical protein